MPLHAQPLGEGLPIVVLPSFSLDHNAMAAAIEPAVSTTTGWSRLYLDLPGTGGSPPVEPRSDAVLEEVLRTIESVLGDQRFLVAGWSYGAYLAAGVARRLPQRVGGLLMVCSGVRIRPKDRNLAGVLSSAAEPDWLTGVPTKLHDHFTHAIGCQTTAVAERVAAALARNGPTDDAYLAALREEGFALSDEDAVHRCDAPVSILTGRRDRVVGYMDQFEALGRYDNAGYLAAGNAGHYLPLEQPELFKAVTLSWLDECQSFSPAVPGDRSGSSAGPGS